MALTVAVAGAWLSTGILAMAFATSDWRLSYVTNHARPDIAWPLRVSGLWAGPEGSLLLWSTMMVTGALIAAVVDRTAQSSSPSAGAEPNSDTSTRAGWTAAHGPAVLIAACHSAIAFSLANPFETLEAPPASGTGLQPVLEHPAMVWHPPLLYAGLVALTIPAGLAVSAAAAERQGGRSVQRAMLWALALLTVGLSTGANWAYVELGWGGYWAWDPIENAGLIAWLLAGATIHRLDPGRSAGRLVTALAVLPAVAALWATTITRTGVLSSVHSFANQPGLRAALLVVAGAITIAVAGVAAAIHPTMTPNTRTELSRHVGSPPSRPAAGVLLAAAGLVAVGTYQPAFANLLGGDDAITGPAFYALMMWPLVVAGAIARVAAATQPGSQRPIILSAVVGALSAMMLAGARSGVLGLVLASSGGAVVGALVYRSATTRHVGGSSLAHIGIGVLLVGVGGALGSSTDTVQVVTQVTTPVEPGDGSPAFDVLFEEIELVEGGGVRRAIASVVVDGRNLQPALVSFVRSGATSVETATDRGWSTDVQVSLVDADANRAIMRISRQRLMSLVWLGVAMIALGFATSAIAGSTAPNRPTRTPA